MVVHHPQEQIIGDTAEPVRTISSFRREASSMALISEIEPKSINDVITGPSWIEAMQEELSQFETNQVWDMVPAPSHQ